MAEVAISPISSALGTKSPSLWKETEIDRISAYLGEPESLLKLRREAFSRLKQTPWPTTLDESWRRNNPRQIGRDQFAPWDLADSEPITSNGHDAGHLDLGVSSQLTLQNCQTVDTAYTSDQAESGLFAGSLKQGFRSEFASKLAALILEVPDDKDSPAVSLLHIAFSHGGSCCLVPDNWSSPYPIFIRHQLSHPGKALFPLNILHFGEGSRATVILLQDDLTDSAAWLGVMTRISLDEGARLDLIAINRGGASVSFYEHLHVTLEKDSIFNLTWFDHTSGWTVMRREALLSGKGAEARMRGAYVGSEASLYDLRTLQNHTGKSTFSDLMFKAVNFGSAKSVFQGLIRVSPEAAQANAYQLNRNLLMSSEARADSIPKLEILVDEVRCTHGASAGKPDPNALFYLRSRGISEKDATRLIVEGFLSEAGNMIQDPRLRDYWQKTVFERFNSAYA